MLSRPSHVVSPVKYLITLDIGLSKENKTFQMLMNFERKSPGITSYNNNDNPVS